MSSNGTASVNLPSAAGTVNDPPAISCYISDIGLVWLVIATDTNISLTCGFGPNSSGTGINVAIVGAPAFWRYRVVVVY